jgi:aldehyde:ferredoxin oxidoreductase
MDRADISRGLEAFYGLMGWDAATGAPTRAAYASLGLAGAADELEAKRLMPRS